jgi:hypothetical protein
LWVRISLSTLITKHIILDIKYKETYKYIIQNSLTYKYLHTYWSLGLNIDIFKVNNILNLVNVYANIAPTTTKINKKRHLLVCLESIKKHKILYKKTFISYLNISLHTPTNTFKIHPSFNHLYLRQSVKGSLIINLLKFFSNWVNISTYLYNTLFYNLKPLLFGTVFFKNEVHSFNWLSLTKLNLNMRLSKTLIFTTPIKRNSVSNKIVKVLFGESVNTSIILDISYHKTTLDYLHKLSVFTVGIVPTTYNAKVVDLALPISVDNIFSQLFILKLLVKTGKFVEYDRYNYYKHLWHSYRLS